MEHDSPCDAVKELRDDVKEVKKDVKSLLLFMAVKKAEDSRNVIYLSGGISLVITTVGVVLSKVL